MAKRSALGKGLGAFFGDDVVRSTSGASAEKKDNGSDNAAGSTMGTTKGPSEQVNVDIRSNSSDSTDKGIDGKDEGYERNDRQSVTLTDDHKNLENEDVSRETFIKITKVEPNREQPRKKFDEEALQELSDSIKEYGILQPLLVKKIGDTYQIIAGERRWRAAKLAGLKEVPVIIREYDKQQSVEIALIENVQRADLNPIEEAFAYQQLMQEFGLKQEEIAARVSKNRATITNSIRLLKLAETVQGLLIDGQISSGHARALLGIEDPVQQEKLAKDIVEKGLSVREVEKLVKLLSKPPKEKKEKEERDMSFIFQDLEERMKGIMGTKVMIHQKDKNKGRIEIEYYSPSELERIVELIESIR